MSETLTTIFTREHRMAVCARVEQIPWSCAVPDHSIVAFLQNPEHAVPEAMLDWAKKLDRNDYRSEAVHWAKRAVECAGNDRRPEVIVTSAVVFLQRIGCGRQAQEIIDSQSTADRENPDLFLLAAQAKGLIRNKQYRRAAHMLADHAESGPVLMHLYADALWMNGDKRAAISCLERFHRQGKADAQNVAKLGKLMVEMNRSLEAIAILEPYYRCMSNAVQSPERVRVAEALGSALIYGGRPEEAVSVLRRLYDRWQGGVGIVNLLASAHIHAKDPEEAIALLEAEVERASHDSASLRILCSAYAYAGQRRSFNALSHVLNVAEQKDYLNAYMFVREGNCAEAVKILEPYIERYLKDGEIDYNNIVMLYIACASEATDCANLADLQRLCESKPSFYPYIKHGADKLRHSLAAYPTGRPVEWGYPSPG